MLISFYRKKSFYLINFKRIFAGRLVLVKLILLLLLFFCIYCFWFIREIKITCCPVSAIKFNQNFRQIPTKLGTEHLKSISQDMVMSTGKLLHYSRFHYVQINTKNLYIREPGGV